MSRKLISGVGINDSNYVVKPKVNGKQVECKFYSVWRNMIRRCYSDICKEKNPTYSNCTVAPEWHSFMMFKSWMEKQDWQGNHLDKDLLVLGSREYGPDTCIFISPLVNSFIVDKRNRGVWWDKKHAKYAAASSDIETDSKRIWLGYFETQHDARIAYLKHKTKMARKLAVYQTDAVIASAILRKYEIEMEEAECKL